MPPADADCAPPMMVRAGSRARSRDKRRRAEAPPRQTNKPELCERSTNCATSYPNCASLANYANWATPSRAKDDTSPNCATNFPKPTGDLGRRGLPCSLFLPPRRIPRRVLPPVVQRRKPMREAAATPDALSQSSALPRAPSRRRPAQRAGFPRVRSGIFAAVTLRGFSVIGDLDQVQVRVTYIDRLYRADRAGARPRSRDDRNAAAFEMGRHFSQRYRRNEA